MLSESATAPSCLVVGVGGEAQIRREAGTGAREVHEGNDAGDPVPRSPGDPAVLRDRLLRVPAIYVLTGARQLQGHTNLFGAAGARDAAGRHIGERWMRRGRDSGKVLRRQ